METKTFRVYGMDGHRQRESFFPSVKYDWSNEQDGVRIVEIFNSDTTGTNEYTDVRITRDDFDMCIREIQGQITDGIFENSRVGKVFIVA